MTIPELNGLLVASVIILGIQFTIGNPFIYLAEKFAEWRKRK